MQENRFSGNPYRFHLRTNKIIIIMSPSSVFFLKCRDVKSPQREKTRKKRKIIGFLRFFNFLQSPIQRHFSHVQIRKNALEIFFFYHSWNLCYFWKIVTTEKLCCKVLLELFQRQDMAAYSTFVINKYCSTY